MPSTPHPFLSWLLALVASAFLGSCGSGAGEHQDPTSTLQPPNVVVILLDTLRADVLSFYGAEDERAPYLAKLATEGTVFEKAFSTSTWTAPATASMLTGVYPDRHGVTRGFLAQFREGEAVDEDVLEQMELLAISTDVPTMAEYFKQAGYNTFALASNVNIGPEMAFDRGFDEFERHDMEPAKFLRDRLLAMRSRIKAGDAPSFLYLHFNDVHKPYEARPRFYRPDEKRDETAEHLERYRSELGYLDSFLARIHQAMAFDDDTLIVVVADHGESIVEHQQFGSHEYSLYDPVARVPLIVRSPGRRLAGARAGGGFPVDDVVRLGDRRAVAARYDVAQCDEQQITAAPPLRRDRDDFRNPARRLAELERLVEDQPAAGPHAARQLRGRQEAAAPGVTVGGKPATRRRLEEIQPMPQGRQGVAFARRRIVAPQGSHEPRHGPGRDDVLGGFAAAQPIV